MDYLDKIIVDALREDLGDGDHSSLSCIPATATGKAQLLVKDNGILAGVELAEKIFKTVDPEFKFEFFKKDGDTIKEGDVVFIVEGKSRSILAAERLALNFMQRMSGIATSTHQMVRLLDGLETKVLDTRKTTPLLRYIEKWAVRIGGGVNHRFGLYDMIMLKDNHIDYAGGIKNAIESVHLYLESTGKDLKIEIEARNLIELEEILAVGRVNRIMLDNFSIPDMITAVKRIDRKFETEASGGITLGTIRSYAETGVDFVSVGALTHKIKSLDLSLKAL